MSVRELHEYFLGQAEWVNRDDTPDIIEADDPNHEISKIGVVRNGACYTRARTC